MKRIPQSGPSTRVLALAALLVASAGLVVALGGVATAEPKVIIAKAKTQQPHVTPTVKTVEKDGTFPDGDGQITVRCPKRYRSVAGGWQMHGDGVRGTVNSPEQDAALYASLKTGARTWAFGVENGPTNKKAIIYVAQAVCLGPMVLKAPKGQKLKDLVNEGQKPQK